ncbi:hypothetical protein F5887DRAFT_1064484 [Amanita rubescens]|nr:hypothetical protein F5887DRAFT_1064484 [Amanita rubescens]
MVRRPPGATPANATFCIRLVPHLIDSRRSLQFDAITRDLCEIDSALCIGLFTDRSGMGLATVNTLGTNKLAFKSKVISRAHAEIWDTKLSSGTFLNHSWPFQLKDGDILQLGVDYQGGAEDIYKSIKIRVAIGWEWQASANAFDSLPFFLAGASSYTRSKPAKLQIPDCCICMSTIFFTTVNLTHLNRFICVSIRQVLFIAPCSHAFHYKCIKPLIEAHHPAFLYPSVEFTHISRK